MKKYIPNILSCIRIAGGLILLFFFNEFSSLFLIIYGVSAATDALDGYFARKFDVCSVLGVAFDTIGDALIGFTPVKVLVVNNLIKPQIFTWLMVSVALFFTSAVISLIKFKKFSFPHTYFDKLLGVCVAASPFLFHLIEIDTLLIIVASIFFIAAIESVIIELKLKEAKPFVASIFHTNK